MKNTLLKKTLTIVATLLLITVFGIFALGSSDSESTTNDQGSGTVENNNALGDYAIEIKSCRLAKSYDGEDVVIITYGFTNNSDEATSFIGTIDANVFQNGIGLNEAYILADSANYKPDNQSKQIQKGATLDVEVAYTLNDSTTDIVVEVEEYFSFTDYKITKTFKIA